MGLWFSRLLSLFGDKEARILVLGLDNAGKTTILYRLHVGEVVQTIPTIGFNVETVTYKNIKFQVWDLGGQTSIRPYWRCYYPNTQAIIYVVDSCDVDRLPTSREEFQAILEEEELKGTVESPMQPQPACRGAAPRPSALCVPAGTKRLLRMTSRLAAATSADFQGCTEALPSPIKVVGMGSSGQDLLAQVAAFPRPDDKLRTEQFEAQGGGNCGNALTAAARLGLAPAIVTKIGGDGVGDGILAEFKGDGVDTQFVLRAAGAPSPFTYIIVDRQGGTRTCIHTPGEPMQPEELTPELAAAVLDGAALVYFDGRLTEAALVLAAAARERAVPVLVEAERLRPGLEQLLGMADYVVSSAHFPESWTGEQCLGDALLATLSRLPRTRWLITTLGSRGSVLLERPSSSGNGAAAAAAEPAVLDELVEQLFSEAANSSRQEAAGPACVSAAGVEVGAGGQAASSGPRSLRLRRGEAETQRVLQAAQAAAAAAAAANADADNAAGYAMRAEAGGSSSSSATAEVVAHVTVAQAARLPAGAVVDTTGAGDAFIGSILYGLATGMPVRRAIQLAAVVAACKCTALGARPGLPQRANLRADLLGA